MSDELESKLAPDLEKKLEASDPEDVVRVVGVIRRPAATSADEPESAPASSRTDYRKAKLRAHEGTRAANAQALHLVRELGLDPRGGEMTGVFSVEASKGDIKRLLQLDDIASLSLDKEIFLERPSKKGS